MSRSTKRPPEPAVVKASSRHYSGVSRSVHRQAQIWLLNGLLNGHGWKRLAAEINRAVEIDDTDPMDLLDDEEIGNDLGTDIGGVLAFLGIDKFLSAMRSPKNARKILLQRLNHLASKQPYRCQNLVRLAGELPLSPVDADLMLFAALVKGYDAFRRCLCYLGPVGQPDAVFERIGQCLRRRRVDIANALSRRGLLADSGMVLIGSESFGGDLDDWLQVLSGLSTRLFGPGVTASGFLSTYLKTSTGKPLPLSAFPQIAGQIAVLVPFLEGSLAAKRPGANVLLFGPPGSGKTALVRALAAKLGARLLEVSVSDDDGDALDRDARARSLRFIGRLGSRKGNALILFDEIEDYFTDFREGEFDFAPVRRGPGKGFSIELLETAPAPTFWVANNVQGVDDALLRRFDYVLELDAPPVAVRRTILEQYLRPLRLAPAVLDRFARHERLTPGLVARAAQTIKMAGKNGLVETAPALEQLLNTQLGVMGLRRLPPASEASMAPYGLQYLGVGDVDIDALIAGLAKNRSGRLLFHGVPGTGKSALARHIAERLGAPFLGFRASDLLSAWVGESEKQIAAMFQKAAERGALLCVDECDSFLRDRRGAHRSWEATLVNEMLTQIEECSGLFVATTNLIDDLDAASLRRFDVKLAFLALKPAQAVALFLDTLHKHQVAIPAGDALDKLRTRIGRLDGLTPGDFASVLRRLRLTGDLSAQTLLAALESEHALKSARQGKRILGFTNTGYA